MSTSRSTRRRLLPLAAGTLLLVGGASPVAAQDVQTSGWDSLGDVTLRVAGEQASETTLTQLARTSGAPAASADSSPAVCAQGHSDRSSAVAASMRK